MESDSPMSHADGLEQWSLMEQINQLSGCCRSLQGKKGIFYILKGSNMSDEMCPWKYSEVHSQVLYIQY